MCKNFETSVESTISTGEVECQSTRENPLPPEASEEAPKEECPSVELQGHVWYYSRKRGVHKPQTAAMKATGYLVTIMLDHPRFHRLYTTFESHRKFEEYYREFKGDRCFQYIIRSDKVESESTPLYLDLDWFSKGPDPEAEKKVKRVVHACKSALETFGFPGVDAHIDNCSCVKRDTGKFKNSYHIYFPVLFESNAKNCMREFVKLAVWRQYLGSDPAMWSDDKEIVDLGVYTRNRCFRVMGSSKSDNLEPDLQIPDDLEPSRLVEFTEVHITKAMVMEKLMGPEKNRSVETVEEEDRDMWDQGEHGAMIETILREKGDLHTRVKFDGTRYVGKTHPRNGRKCLISGEIHTTNDVYFGIKDNMVYYHCFGSRSHERCAGIRIGRLDAGKEYMHRVEKYQMWAPETRVVEHSDQYVKDIEKAKFTKAYAIIAGCGKGKSTAISRYVRGTSTSVLIVTGRISLSRAFKKNFPDFSHYKDKDAFSADRLIVEYESLGKIRRKYDIVVLDEARTLCNNMVWLHGNPCDVLSRARLLKVLAKSANLVLWTDADLDIDPACPTVMNEWFEPFEIEVHRYTTQRLTYDFHMVNGDREYWVDKLRASLSDGKRVGVACKTKSSAHQIAESCNEFKSLVLSSDTPDSVIRNLDDVSAVLGDAQLVLLTSKVSVGVSIEDEFDEVFVDITGPDLHSACTRDLFQTLRRFRHVKNRDCYALTNGHTPKDQSYKERMAIQCAYMNEREHQFNEYAGLLQYDWTFEEEVLRRSPHMFAELYNITQVERMDDSITAFVSQAYRNGSSCFHTNTQRAKLNDREERAKKKVKLDKEHDMMGAILTAMQSHMDGTLLGDLYNAEEEVKCHRATLETRNFLKVGHVMKHWEHGIHTPEEFEWAVKNKEAIMGYALHLRMDEDRLIKREVNRVLQANDLHDINSPMILLQLKTLQEMLNHLGYEGPHDFDTLVEDKKFEQDEVKKMIKTIQVANKTRRVQKKPTGAIRSILYRLAGTSLVMVRASDGKAKKCYYQIMDPEYVGRMAKTSDFYLSETTPAMQAQESMIVTEGTQGTQDPFTQAPQAPQAMEVSA